MAASSTYNIALEITAQTEKALKKISDLGDNITKLGRSRGGASGGIMGGLGMAVSLAGRLGGALTMAGGAFMAVGRAVFSIFSEVFGIVKNIASTLLGLPMKGLKIALAGGAAVAGAAYASHKFLSPAARRQQLETQMGLLGMGGFMPTAEKLSKGSMRDEEEIAQAAVQARLMGLKMDEKAMKTVIDTAALYKKPLDEIIQIVSMARMGFLRPARSIGITPGMLAQYGGGKGASGDAIAKALLAAMAAKSAGADKAMSQTYLGQTAMLGKAFEDAIKGMGGPLLGIATDAAKKMTDYINSFNWADIGARIRTGIGKIFTEEGRAELLDAGLAVARGIGLFITRAWDELLPTLEWTAKFAGLYIYEQMSGAADYFQAKLYDAFTVVWDTGSNILAAGLELLLAKLVDNTINALRGILHSFVAAFGALLNPLLAKFGIGEKVEGGFMERFNYFKGRMDETFPAMDLASKTAAGTAWNSQMELMRKQSEALGRSARDPLGRALAGAGHAPGMQGMNFALDQLVSFMGGMVREVTEPVREAAKMSPAQQDKAMDKFIRRQNRDAEAEFRDRHGIRSLKNEEAILAELKKIKENTAKRQEQGGGENMFDVPAPALGF